MAKKSKLDESKRTAGLELKAMLVRTGMTYGELAKLFSKNGLKENSSTIAHKVSRGSYTHAWLLLVLDSLDKEIEFKDKNK